MDSEKSSCNIIHIHTIHDYIDHKTIHRGIGILQWSHGAVKSGEICSWFTGLSYILHFHICFLKIPLKINENTFSF